MRIQQYLERELAGIPLRSWVVALVLLVAIFLLLGVAKRLLAHRLKKLALRTETQIDDLLADLVGRTTRFFLFAIALYVAAHYLLAPYLGVVQGPDGQSAPNAASTWSGWAQKALVIAAIVQAGLWGRGLLAYWIQRAVHTRPADDPARTMGASILGFIGATFLWSFVALLCLANVGVDVTALITGLGVGGIAVALALQNILGDLFASITILLDKPFVVGDAIKVGDFDGTIERIGIKTTRLRSVGGEMIVMGNADLVSSRVRNYKQMEERRTVTKIGVTYQTPHAKLTAIPGLIEEIVAATPDVRFDRCHLQGFGDSSVDFELVYFTTRSDYLVFTQVQQAIHLSIFQRFESEGIEFAYPTRALYFAGGPLAITRTSKAQEELSLG